MAAMVPRTPTSATGWDIVSAGAVVTRKGPAGRELLLVHRPKYDDWSFPKGKQDPGEHVTATAVREVLEETGVEIRLGRPLRPQVYAVSGGRAKKVHFWVGHVMGDDDLSTYLPNDEVDDLGWFRLDEAGERLTYADDLELLHQYREHQKPTSALVVLRHAKAVPRGQWDHTDEHRPLTDLGHDQAHALIPLLHAYGVARVLTSPSTRCVQTVQPYASHQVIPVGEAPPLSEEGFEPREAVAVLEELMRAPESAVLCTHRPVLPRLLDRLGIAEEPLAPGELVVCHHRRGELVATERHLPA